MFFINKYVGELFTYISDYNSKVTIRVFNIENNIVKFDYVDNESQGEIGLDFFEQFLNNGYIKRKDKPNEYI